MVSLTGRSDLTLHLSLSSSSAWACYDPEGHLLLICTPPVSLVFAHAGTSSPVIIFLRMMEEWEREGQRGRPGEDEAREKVRGGRERERERERE
jgi:hypothetical protein